MYYGEAQTVLDEKGRITVSRKFREIMELRGDLLWYMTRGYDGAIFLFPKDQWDTIRAQAAKHSSMEARAVDFRRMFFGSVAESRPDRQGRMSVPAHLREHANLEKEAVLIGCDDHLELWSREGWRQYQGGMEAAYKEMGSELFRTEPNGGTVREEE